MIGLLFILGAISSIKGEENHASIFEDEIVSITGQKSLSSAADFINIRTEKDKIYLRSSSGEGSLLNIKENITTDNWSTEFVVRNLNLKDIEKAGIYLWYLDKPLEKGKYKGGNPVFNGFIVGVEFSKDRADIVFAFNYGLNFENKEMETTRYDHINPLLIEHLEEFKVKVVHTEKNFKIELYDLSNNILSDSFRIHEPLIMNKRAENKIFAITTKYEHCKSDVFFELKDMKIHSREETHHYDMRDIKTEYNQYPKKKSDEELRTTIAEINHFLSYLTIALGTSSSNNIVEMVLSIKKKLRGLKDSVESIAELTKESSKTNISAQESTIKSKMDEVDAITNELMKKTEIIKSKLRKLRKTKENHKNSTFRWMILAFGMILIGILLKLVVNRIFSRSISAKKE